MANAYKNKVVYYGETLIDISSDTVTPENLLQGYTAHDKSGAPIVGTFVPGTAAVVVTEDEDPNGGTIVDITAIDLSNDTVTADKLLNGYTAHDRQGNLVTGTYIPSGSVVLQEKTVNPSTSQQIITPDTGYDALSRVTVNAMPSFVTYRTGSSDPDDSVGVNGDIYLKV